MLSERHGPRIHSAHFAEKLGMFALIGADTFPTKEVWNGWSETRRKELLDGAVDHLIARLTSQQLEQIIGYINGEPCENNDSVLRFEARETYVLVGLVLKYYPVVELGLQSL